MNRIWFYYAQEIQVGPLTELEIQAVIQAGTIQGHDFVYREGFEDWKPLKNVPELLKSDKIPPTPLATGQHHSRPVSVKPSLIPVSHEKSGVKHASERRVSVRAPIHENIVAHNEKHIISGALSDISSDGAFLETTDTAFQLNDGIKITVKKGKGLGKPLHLKGTVIRKITNGPQPHGYGIQLQSLSDQTRTRIIDYVRNAKG